MHGKLSGNVAMRQMKNGNHTMTQAELERARKRVAELESALAVCFQAAFPFKVLDAIPAPIFVKDYQHCWVYVNRAFSDVIGVPMEELIGKSDFDFYPPEQARIFWANDDRVLDTGEVVASEDDVTLRGRVRRILTVQSLFVDPATSQRRVVGYLTDITARKLMQDELLASEERFRALVETSEDCIFELDADNRFTYNSPALAQIVGYTPEELRGHTPVFLTGRREALRIMRIIGPDMAARRPYRNLLQRCRHKDGSEVLVEVGAVPIFGTGGEYAGYRGVARNVTERERAAEALRASEERFRALVETTSDCIFEYDAQFRFTYNSPAVRDILGFTPQDLMGLSPAHLSSEEEVARILALLGPDLEAYRPFRNLLQRCLHKDGSEVLVEVSAVPIFDSGGQFAGYRGVTRDVTERERAAAALRASEERFRALVETTSDCIWEHGPDLRITYMSPQCFDILGYTPEEMLGKTPFDVAVPEEVSALREDVVPLLDRREPFRGVIQHCLGKDGRLVAIESNGSPAYDGEGNFIGYHGVSRDVTAREQAAAALRESEERLRKLVENIPVLLHAHDEDNNYVFWNRECERVLGYAAREVIGNAEVRARLYPESEAVALFEQWHGDTREYRDVEIPMACKDGTRKVISWTSVSETCPLPGWGMWETGVDVTAAREARERLRQSYQDLERRVAERTAELARAEARYRSIYENAPVGIFQKTLQGRFLAANAQLARIYGYESPEELMAEAADAPGTLYVDPEAWAAMRRLLTNQDRLDNFEVLVRRADGRLAWTSRMVRVVCDAEGKAVYYEGFVSDITDRRQAEEQVHSLTRELLRAQESERQRISRELHDNMAQTLSSLAIAWKTMFDGHPEVAAEVRQRAEGLAAHLSGLIRSVRDLAYDLRPLALDELGLARAVRMHCEEFADQTGLTVEFSVAGLDSLTLETDTAINIFRLVQEALRNVAKHAGADTVVVKLVASHPHLLVRVEDDGQGFDMAERRAVTRPGERRMGLQSMEERVLLLGGTFKVHSRPGQGTRVFAEIPVPELGGRR